MSRRRELRRPVAQGTWRSGALHVWGWDGDEPAGTPWLYAGLGRSLGWHDVPVSYGQIGRLELAVPDGPSRSVPAVRLDPHGAVVWLADTPDESALSPSLAWFAHLARLAVELVSAGRIVPVITDEGPARTARWRPCLDDELTGHLAVVAAAAPPVCRVGTGASTTDILTTLVDGVARNQLHLTGWRPELGRRRLPEVRAARATFTALASPDPAVRDGDEEYLAALGHLEQLLDRHARRVAGEPVVRVRVRLDVPDDPLDPWRVGLELVDEADPGRWCRADDVRDHTAAAVELAGGEAHLDRLATTLRTTVDAIVARVDVLGGFAGGDGPTSIGPTSIELGIEEADELLDVAPHELHELGVELLGPERLVRSSVAVRGRATPAPADDRRARFAAEALVEWTATADGAPLSDLELERLATAGSRLLHTGHRWVRIDPAAVRRARRTLDDRRRDDARVGPARLLALASGPGPDGSPDAAPEAAMEGESGWVADLLAGLPDRRLAEATEPADFRGELRPYQRRGLAWMRFLADLGLGGCLADDMGLGKTATTLAHLVDRPGPHLVVCPLSVVHNWEGEARRFAPGMQVAVHHGGGRQLLVGEGALAPPDLVLTTYGIVARDPELATVEWSTVVLDEAQTVKNPATKAARAVRRLPAAQRLALTGTPVENRLAELWAILDAVNPGLLGGQQRFRERYAMPIERHGDTDVAEALRRLTRPFVLRRTKADRSLLPDLPDKIEQLAFAQLTREQTVLYQQIVDQLLADADELEGMQRRGRVLAALTRLKQICNHPAHALRDAGRLTGRSGKLARFDELVDELLDVGERALVFTQFREMGDLLQRHLRERLDLAAPFLHGGVGRGARAAMVEAFQSGSAAPLLIVSLKAGGTGLNLTAASQVIHYDRWWNPAVEDQATDRAWRIGQARTVNVHKLVCQGTVEERIGQVIDEKRALADAVVGTGESWLSELATDDLRDLVRLEHAEPSLAERRRRRREAG